MYFPWSVGRVERTTSQTQSGRKFSLCIIALILFGATSETRAETAAFSWSGENILNGQPGPLAGGYFLLDLDALPVHHYTPAGDDTHGVEYNNFLPWAVDDMLSDAVSPLYGGRTPPELQELGVKYFSNQMAVYPNGTAKLEFTNYYQQGLGFSGVVFDSAGLNGAGQIPLREAIAGMSIRPMNYPQDIGPINDYRTVYIPSPSISNFTAQDVFRNPMSFPVPVVYNDVTIEAKFTPHINIAGHDVAMPIDDVALLFGVDHFNWIQTITLPTGWSVREHFFDGTIGPVMTTYVDPVPNSLGRYVITAANGYSWSPELPPGGADDAPFYGNEPLPIGPTGMGIGFHDGPTMPIAANPGLLSRHFHTELVGVMADGISYKSTGVYFDWDCNVSGEGEYSDTDQGGSLRFTYVGGSITNLQLTVPEPSSVAMATIAAFALAAVAWRKRPALR